MTGERLFLLYAFPCVEIREQKGQITPAHGLELRAIVDQNKEPSRELLDRCFPNATHQFMTMAGISSLCTPWPVEDVRKYWRAHRHEGCGMNGAVIRGVVQSVGPTFVLLRTAPEVHPRIAINNYNLPIQIGDVVYCHNIYVVEVDKPC